jgi:hypothetical protein
MKCPIALALTLLASLVSLSVPAAAQEPTVARQPAVTLTLLSQTPWNGPEARDVELRIRAENVGEVEIDELSLGLTLWSPVPSRSQYEAALLDDPAGSVQLLAKPYPRTGSMLPGDVRDFTIPLELPLDRLDADSSRVYPLTIDLRSGFTSLAAVRTSVIFLVRDAETPLNVSWTFVLSAPLMTGPDGVFSSSALERSISPGGRLSGMISAVSTIADAGEPVDVVVSPLLLMQLDEMRDGYTISEFGQIRLVEEGEGATDEAAASLEALRSIASASNVELSALPFSGPRLPALAAGGLSRDVSVQLERGRQVVATLLGRNPDPVVLRPPDSALDDESLQAIAAHGVGLLFLDHSTAPPPEQERGFAPPPTTTLRGRDVEITAVVGDPSVRTLLTSTSTAALDDPVRAAQAVLGELATIWLEQPSVERGVSVIFGESAPQLPGAFFPPLARAIAARPPWLAQRTATALALSFPPTQPAAGFVASEAAFTQPYAESIKAARRRINTLRTMLVEPSDEPARLETLLLLAESGRFVGNETEGSVFIDRVHDRILSVFGSVHAPEGQAFTLTASAAEVPVRVSNDGDIPLRVVVRLESPYLRPTQEQVVELPPATTQTLTFDLELRTTGRREVVIEILSPSRRPIGPGGELIVRSTDYNRVALWITLGAAGLALLVWARRFLPRPVT